MKHKEEACYQFNEVLEILALKVTLEQLGQTDPNQKINLQKDESKQVIEEEEEEKKEEEENLQNNFGIPDDEQSKNSSSFKINESEDSRTHKSLMLQQKKKKYLKKNVRRTITVRNPDYYDLA
eukprot:CAMPEP_0170566376 /NCGR_PEP_ID=MMETSP0211-20121228/79797_1 /TAXON_ID=311385 /ORGANISM="Pseudokeronopsis sp., Strain OXSARD2" /LENGTH=122 /DNA_ID=CAMNT_0010887531 /DNA_START=2109 /DNA_END=2477 /DNA_ORIENTATION=-